ncbi:MAG: T9SS type A sorting domain-containing protein [Ignavibacterium sp.]|nr:T9SS type A sorting domain-containing protein [Ignavibacterium sp.]
MKNIIIIVLLWSFNVIGFSQWFEQEPKIYSVIYKSITFTNNSNGTIVGTNGIILRSTNAGESWDSLHYPINSDLEKVFFIDDANGWIAGDSGLILKTTNGGLDWTSLTTNFNEKIFSVFFESNTFGWVAGKNIIYKTTDGGINWLEKKRDNNWYYDLYFADQNNGWVVGDSAAFGIILRTTDGGDSWSKIYETYFGYLSSINFTSQNIAYAAGENSILAKTTDGGLTWLDNVVISQGDYDWQDSYFIDDNMGWLVDLFGAVVKTSDGGLTWTEQNPRFLTTGGLYSVFFSDSLNGWAVGAGEYPNLYGRIIRTTNGGVTGIEDETQIPVDYFLFQNYPNPFNPSTTIKFALPVRTNLTINVYNTLGEKISEIFKGEMETGYHEVQFNALGLSSGIYFYKIESENFNSTKKMILMK